VRFKHIVGLENAVAFRRPVGDLSIRLDALTAADAPWRGPRKAATPAVAARSQQLQFMHEGETMVITRIPARSVLDLQNLIAGLSEREMKAQASGHRCCGRASSDSEAPHAASTPTTSFTNLQPIACWIPVRGQLCR
jgi:hypothetical protein